MNEKGRGVTPEKLRGVITIATLIVISIMHTFSLLLVCDHGEDNFFDSFSRTLEFAAHVDDFVIYHRCEIHKILAFYDCAFFEQI